MDLYGHIMALAEDTHGDPVLVDMYWQPLPRELDENEEIMPKGSILVLKKRWVRVRHNNGHKIWSVSRPRERCHGVG